MHSNENERLRFLLLSEFDVDAGACFRSSYPDIELDRKEGSTDLQDFFANHMLPDGAEKVPVSSTIFFLHRKKTTRPIHRYAIRIFRSEKNELGPVKWTSCSEGLPMLPEVLQLDEGSSSVSLQCHSAFVLPPSNVHKSLRLELLQDTPLEVLHALVGLQSEAEKDDSTAPSSPLFLHNELFSLHKKDLSFLTLSVDGKVYGVVAPTSAALQILQKYQKIVEDRSISTASEPSDKKFQQSGASSGEDPSSTPLFAISAVISKKDSKAKRGGITKAVAAMGNSLPWLQAIFPVLARCAQRCCDVQGAEELSIRKQVDYLKECFDALAKMQQSILELPSPKSPLHIFVQQHCTGTRLTSPASMTSSISALGSAFDLSIPLYPSLEDLLLPQYNLERLIIMFGRAFMVLFFGVLTGKRIVVVSRESTAFDVSQVALCLGIIGSFMRPDFLHTKVFPYVSINDTSFSDEPGYIIGTLNPIFENSKAWDWDLLCDLDARSVRWRDEEPGNAKAASSSEPPSSSNEALDDLPTHVALLWHQLIATIQQLQLLHVPLKQRCLHIQSIMEEYCHTLVAIHNAGSLIDPSVRSECFSQAFPTQLLIQCQLAGLTCFFTKGILEEGERPEVLLLCAALRRCHNQHPSTISYVLDSLNERISEREDGVNLFLRRMSLAVGGLNVLCLQLAHSTFSVQQSTWKLIQRIQKYPLGKSALSSVHNFSLGLLDEFTRLPTTCST